MIINKSQEVILQSKYWYFKYTLKCSFFTVLYWNFYLLYVLFMVSQVRSQLLPVWTQRSVVPCCSAATSPRRRATPCAKCAGSTSTRTSSWRTSRARRPASAARRPTCCSTPRAPTPATSPSRGCGPMTRAATCASLMFTPRGQW